jgi:hypothetical protein
MKPDRRRLLTLITSGIALGLGLLTLVTAEWIELLTGWDPDGGSGSLERFIALALICVGVVLGAASVKERTRRSPAPKRATGPDPGLD